MFPFMPSFPSAPNQVQTHGSNDHTAQQVVLQGPHMANSSNLGSGNVTHQFPCSCPHQIPSQLHALNHQIPIPTMNSFNNQNTHLSNYHGNAMSLPNRPPSMPFPCFPNVGTSNHLALQNGHVGMPMPSQNLNHMAALPLHGHFCNVPQNMNPNVPPRPNGQFLYHNGPQNLKQIMHSPHGCLQAQNSNQIMPIQPSGQFCSHNLPQNLNQISGLPNGQFCLQNPIQNLNQVMPMQCSQHPMIHTHAAPFNIHQSSHPSVACHNQIPHVPGSQNHVFALNSQFGSGNSNVNPNSTVLSNEATQFDNQGQMHLSLKNMQSSGFQQAQGVNADSGGNNIVNANQGNPTSKNFMGYGKGTNMRFQKSQSHHMANGKGNLKHASGNRGKGNHNKGAGKSHLANSSKKAMEECQRYLLPNYTEEEIRQWREARKKNFPSKTNVEKMLAEKLANRELIDNDVKVRRQQLREILAKQAEMGVEVAELPPNYLSESENQASQKELENQDGKREDERRLWNKRGRFRNKYDKRDNKHGQQNRWAKKQKLGGDESSPASISNKRRPTLLQKLLNADIKRDKSHLLQVLRFMMLNSFFKDWPEKPLDFPLITVKDESIMNNIVKKKPSHEGGDRISGVEKVLIEDSHQNNNRSVIEEDSDHDEDGNDHSKKELTCDHIGENGGISEQIEKSESEEGEITD